MREAARNTVVALVLAVTHGCGPSVAGPEGASESPTTGGMTGTASPASVTGIGSTTTDIVGTTESLPDVANPEPEPPVLECENPEFRCSIPISPASSHNGLGAIDARGCLRPRCDWTDECGAEEVCIMGEAFGECVAAVSGCDEVDGMCSCLAGGVCNAAYCASIVELPLELVDVVEGPGAHARWVGGCSPDGHLITTLTLGLDEPSCTSTASGPSFEVTFPGTVPDSRDTSDERVFGELVDFPLVESSFDANGNGIADDGPIAGGVIRLRGPTTGRYEFVHAGRLLFGQYSDITACPLRTPCE